MKFLRWNGPGIMAGAWMMATLPAAQAQAARTVYFWNGSAEMSAAKAAPWGNGASKESKKVEYEGSEVLELTTRNPAEGVRFDLNPPVDLAPYKAAGFLRLRVKFNELASTAAPGGYGEGGSGGYPGGSSSGGSSSGGSSSGGSSSGGYPGAYPGGSSSGGYPGGGSSSGYPGGSSGGPGFRPPAPPRVNGNYQMSPRFAQAPRGYPGGGYPGGGSSGGYPGGGSSSGSSSGSSGGYPGAGYPGAGYPGAGYPGAGGELGVGAAPFGPAPQKTPITQLNLMLMLENGILAGHVDVDMEKVKPDEEGWRLFVLPVAQMRSTAGANGAATRLIVTSDQEDTFMLAQAALVIESAKVTVSIRRPTDAPDTQISEITVNPGTLSLVADVEAGAADPAVEWNFDADNAGNLPMTPPPGAPVGGEFGPPGGPGEFGVPIAPGTVIGPPAGGSRVDARGLVAKFEYPNEEQNYRVEVTVRDRSNKKKPVTASILVKVRG